MGNFQLTAGGGSFQALAAAVLGMKGIVLTPTICDADSSLGPSLLALGPGCVGLVLNGVVNDCCKTSGPPRVSAVSGASLHATAAPVSLRMSWVPDGETSCRLDLERPKANWSAAGS